jgi:hypothetical protein
MNRSNIHRRRWKTFSYPSSPAFLDSTPGVHPDPVTKPVQMNIKSKGFLINPIYLGQH